MTSLKRPLYFFLILGIAILLESSRTVCGQSPDARPKATGSISGRVTLGGKPATGIAVAAFSIENLNRRMANARTLTDSEGQFRLSGLSPAQYQVAALTPDLTTLEPRSEMSYGFVYFGSSKNIILAAGEEVEGVDLKLARGGVITGRVTDAENKPVIEEQISLQAVDENGKPASMTTRLPYGPQIYQTDDRGVYRIYGLQAGHYKVSIGTESGGGMNYNGRGYYLRTYHPDTADPAKATIVELTEGSEATNIDIQVGRREETYSVTGLVVDSETGLPISGTRISYLVAPQDPQRASPFLSGAPTGARGEFRIDGLAPGRYGAYVSPEYYGGDYYSDPVYFSIADKDVTGVEVKAIRGLSVGGIVVTEGDVPKDMLAQLDGFRISANVMPASRTQPSDAGLSVIASDGSFHIGGLRPGRVSVGLASFAATSKRPSILRIEHDGVGVTQGFELQPGRSISDLRVVITFGAGVIRGAVRFEGGSLPPNTRVLIRCAREGERESGGAQPDSRGHFLINSLSPGTYEVTLQMLSNANTGSFRRPPPPQKQFVTVTNDVESEVTFIVDLKPKEGGP